MQGLCFAPALANRLSQFSPNLIMDLAGNAFDASTCLGATMVLMTFLAICDDRISSRSESAHSAGPTLPTPISSGCRRSRQLRGGRAMLDLWGAADSDSDSSN